MSGRVDVRLLPLVEVAPAPAPVPIAAAAGLFLLSSEYHDVVYQHYTEDQKTRVGGCAASPPPRRIYHAHACGVPRVCARRCGRG